MTKQFNGLMTFAGLSGELRSRGMTRGISVQTLHRWRAAGRLKAVRIGGTWYTTLDDFERFVALRTPPTSKTDSEAGSSTTRAMDTSLERAGW